MKYNTFFKNTGDFVFQASEKKIQVVGNCGSPFYSIPYIHRGKSRTTHKEQHVFYRLVHKYKEINPIHTNIETMLLLNSW